MSTMPKLAADRTHGLRGDPDYYCDYLEAGGETYHVRELAEGPEYDRFNALDKEIGEMRLKGKDDPASVDDKAYFAKERELINHVVGCGVVKWTLKDPVEPEQTRELSAENIAKLPPPVKMALYRLIQKHTLLTYEERDFLAASP